MSSNSFESTVDLEPRHSILALKLIFLLHVGPLLLLPFAMQPGTPLMALLGLFALSWLTLRRHPVFGYGLKALTRLTWHAEGGWTLHDAYGSYEAQLLPGTYVHSRLIVLRFQLKDGRRRTRAARHRRR